MAVKIRLARHGATKKPFYRIVVADGEWNHDRIESYLAAHPW